MIKIINCSDPSRITGLLNRTREDKSNVDGVVREIMDDVKARGDEALIEYALRFDGASLSSLEVSAEEIDAAYDSTDEAFIEILNEAAANIRAYHEKQVRTGFAIAEKPGIVLGQKVTPLERVGVYVPGGTASYPSTVLMDVIPAKIAGVGEIIMVSPPGKDGNISPDILCAAKIAGADRIFKAGGAQAVAALCYGTRSVPKVNKIVGPGNIYVATAKRFAYGLVDIDMIAGPSEILVIADGTANPDHVAVDLLSQAEHDKFAASFLVTTCPRFAEKVRERVEYYCERLPRREIAACSIDNNGAIIVTDDLEKAVAISNEIAPEHLEVCIDNPFSLLSGIKNAGSIFLGKYAPEALGDYFAGPNHTLPTSGTAKFSSPLSVDDFVKKSSYIYYEEDALRAAYEKIDMFARREGLDAHADSVSIRFR